MILHPDSGTYPCQNCVSKYHIYLHNNIQRHTEHIIVLWANPTYINLQSSVGKQDNIRNRNWMSIMSNKVRSWSSTNLGQQVSLITTRRQMRCVKGMMTSSNGNISALLAIYAGNSPVTGESPSQRPVTRGFDVFFDLRLNKRLSKQLWGWWFETLSRPLWRHCNGPAKNHHNH